MALAEMKKLESAQERLRQNLFRAQDSRSPGAAWDISQQIEKNRIAIDAETRANLAARDAVEAKYQAYKKLQAAAFAAQGQTAFAQTMEGNPLIVGDMDAARLKKINDYLLQKRKIMGSTSGMAPGFANLLATEAGTSPSAAKSLLDKQNAYLARKAGIMGTMGSGMAPGFSKLLATEAALAAGTAGAKTATGFLAGFMERMKGTGGSGMSQLISVFSNTLSSLGAGISPARIFAQQAPNFIQAFTLMSKNAFSAIMRFLFSPFTWAVTGMVAVAGGGAYLIYRYFKNLSLGLENVANKFGLAKVTSEELNKAMKSGEDAARGYKSWLDEIGRSTDTLGDVTERLLRKMREQAKLEQDLARARGASPQTITGMEISQLEREIAVLEEAHQKQKALNEENLKAANLAAAKLSSNNNAENVALMDNASRGRATAAKILDVVKNQLDMKRIEELRKLVGNNPNAVIQELKMVGSGQFATLEKVSTRAADALRALESTLINVDEEGMKFHGTLADAEREFKGAIALEKDFQEKQDALTRALKQKQDAVEQGKAVDKSLTEQIDQLKTDLGLKQKFGPQLDAYSRGGGGRGGGDMVTDRQRIGLGAASSINVSMLETARKQLSVQQELLRSNQELARQIYEAGGF